MPSCLLASEVPGVPVKEGLFCLHRQLGDGMKYSKMKITSIEIKKRWNSEWEMIPVQADDLCIVQDHPHLDCGVCHLPVPTNFYSVVTVPLTVSVYLKTAGASIPIYDVRLPQLPEVGSVRERWEGECD